jgi:hypothetical protein
VLDWLSDVCDSWYMMADLRNIMSGIFTKAQEWEIIDESRVNPMSKVKLPRKWKARPERILDENQTARVLALGNLIGRYQDWIASNKITDPEAWIFAQEDDPRGRCGTREFGRPSRRRRPPRAATSPVWGHIPYAEPTSPGGRKWAARPSRLARSPHRRPIEAAGGTDPPDSGQAGEGGQAGEQDKQGCRNPGGAGGMTA